jgi:hypothetical protein
MEQLRLRPGQPGFSVGKFFGYYSLRFVPFISLRKLIARVLAAYVNWRTHTIAAVGTAAPAADSVRLSKQLREVGVAFCEPIPEAHIADIREYLRDKEMLSVDGRRFTEDSVPNDVRLATFPLLTILHCPHLLELMNSPQSLQVATEYLRCRPTISSVRIDYSFPGSSTPEDVQRFHRDHDDWAFLKFFLYLTDVDALSGPHEFVQGSHRKSERLSAEFYPDAEVDRRFGLRNVLRIIGPRGTGFYEDTWGVHKGAIPTDRPRLMFQVQYSIFPVFKYNYQPLAVAGTRSLDRYINRLLVASPQES